MQNLIVTKDHAGEFQKDITSSKDFDLLSVVDNVNLKTSSVKSVIHPVWLQKKLMCTAKALCAKNKVMEKIPILRDNLDYKSFKECVRYSDLLDGLDNQKDIDEDVNKDMGK